MVAPTPIAALTTTSAVKRKVERDVIAKKNDEEPPKKRPPLLSLDGMPRPRLEDNPLRKKRKLFDTNDEPSFVKKKVRLMSLCKVFYLGFLKIYLKLFLMLSEMLQTVKMQKTKNGRI